MLCQNNQHFGQTAGGPFLEELVCGTAAAACTACHAGGRRRLAKVGEVGRKVALVEDDWISLMRRTVETFGHEHDGANMHGPAPERRQQLALDLDVPDIF